MLVAPLIADGVPLGVLHMGQQRATRWRARHITQARTLADHIALVLLRLRNQDTRVASEVLSTARV